MEKIDQLLKEHSIWKKKEPFLKYQDLYSFGRVTLRLSQEDIAVRKSAVTSADQEQSLYIPIVAARDLYKFLGKVFEDIDGQ